MIKISAILSFLNNAWPYAVAILLFLILIIIHEFGHFLLAKLNGVKVNEFAIGFGPKLFKFQKGETLYSVNLIPLGGYCAMEGEDEESDNDRAFCNKKPWRRFLIVAAGAVFNIILGVILVGISLIPGERFSTKTIAKFSENAVSVNSGLQVNDEILSVDGRRIFTTYDLSYAFTGVKDGKVDLTVRRDGEKVTLPDVQFKTEEADGMSFISVDFYVYGKEKGFLEFIEQTFLQTISYIRVIWFSLIDLIGGKFGISAVSGPVGVTAAIGSVAKQNILNIIPIMALITINLGIFNLLPLPALDGGRIMFILFEMIFKRSVPQKYEALVHTVGIIILFAFMILITFKDILALVTG